MPRKSSTNGDSPNSDRHIDLHRISAQAEQSEEHSLSNRWGHEIYTSTVEVVPFTSDIAQTAAIIYQELKSVNRLIDMRDILIAASALTHGLPVMTLNIGHFDRVTGLQLVSPPFSRAQTLKR